MVGRIRDEDDSRDNEKSRANADNDLGYVRGVDRKLSTMGRRRFTKTLASLGFSTAAITGLSQDTLADENGEPSSRITAVELYRHTNHEEVAEGDARPEREKKFYTMPRDQWIRAKGASNASTALLEQLPNDPLVHTSVTTDSNSNVEIVVEHVTKKSPSGQVRTPGITTEELQARIPKHVVGTVGRGKHQKQTDKIPVRFEKRTEHEEAYFNYDYDPVPGGCVMGADDGGVGTCATPAYYNYGETYGWVHCSHVLGRETGVTMFQQGDAVGESEVVTSEEKGDVSFIKETLFGTAGSNVEYDLAADQKDSYEGWGIYGVVSEDRLIDMNIYDDTVDCQGRTTGRHRYCEVLRLKDTSYGQNSRMVIEADSDSGDSGMPYYWQNSNDEAYIAGVHGGSTEIDGDGNFDEAYGNTMFWAEDRLGVSI